MIENDKAFDGQQKFHEKIVRKKTLETLPYGHLESSSPTKFKKIKK